MQVIVFNKPNLHSINNKQWSGFCKYIEPFVVAYTKFPIYSAIVSVEEDGNTASIVFDVKVRESLQTVKVGFDKFLCKSWQYDNLGKKYKNIPPHNVTLAWQVFLTKVFGEDYKYELETFYKKNKISTKLITTLIKNSMKEFDI